MAGVERDMDGAHLWRLWLAFLSVPLVSAIAASVVFPMFPLEPGTSQRGAPIAFVTGITAVFVIVVGALPAFLSLKRRGPISLFQTLCAGAALGNLPFAVVAVFSAVFALAHVAAGTISDHLVPISSLIGTGARFILIGTAVGTVSAAVFWFVGLSGTDLAE